MVPECQPPHTHSGFGRLPQPQTMPYPGSVVSGAILWCVARHMPRDRRRPLRLHAVVGLRRVSIYASAIWNNFDTAGRDPLCLCNSMAICVVILVCGNILEPEVGRIFQRVCTTALGRQSGTDGCM